MVLLQIFTTHCIIDYVQSSLLKEAYKTQTELETSLGLAKSNLQLVQMNNEMLEEALRRDGSGKGKDVGWRRWSAREVQIRARDRLSGESSRPASFTASVPSLPSHLNQELQDLAAQLERERVAHMTVKQEKAALENEVESLSQALFEEASTYLSLNYDTIAEGRGSLLLQANKMVATERIKLAQVQEELSEVCLEKEALKSALRLIEDERLRMDNSLSDHRTVSSHLSHSRTSSREAVKSRPSTPSPSQSSPTSAISTSPLPTLPPSPPQGPSEDTPGHTLSYPLSSPGFGLPHSIPPPTPYLVDDESPWADAKSSLSNSAHVFA